MHGNADIAFKQSTSTTSSTRVTTTSNFPVSMRHAPSTTSSANSVLQSRLSSFVSLSLPLSLSPKRHDGLRCVDPSIGGDPPHQDHPLAARASLASCHAPVLGSLRVQISCLQRESVLHLLLLPLPRQTPPWRTLGERTPLHLTTDGHHGQMCKAPEPDDSGPCPSPHKADSHERTCHQHRSLLPASIDTGRAPRPNVQGARA